MAKNYSVKRFVQINKSCREGTLPLDNYSGLKPGDQVIVLTARGRDSELFGEVHDVRFINTPSSCLYYVYVQTQNGLSQYYPEQLRKLNL